MRLCCASATEKGNYRAQNQDAICIRKLEQKGRLLAVAAVFDGIGGLEQSERASGLLKEELCQWFEEICGWVDLGKVDPEVLFSHFRDEAEYLNGQIRNLQENLRIRTGSTMSALLLADGQYRIIHVGDSRIYNCRDPLQRLTMDDTVVHRQETGSRNYLSNYMGKEDELHFSEYCGSAEEGDCFLLCSDGFYHHLQEEDGNLLAQARSEKELEKCLNSLLSEMEKRGEKDNISAAVVKLMPKKRFVW